MKLKKYAVPMVTLAVLGAVGSSIYMNYAGPAVGTVNNNSEAAATVAKQPTQTATIDNGYATYSYDTVLKPVEAETVRPPILASNIFRLRTTFTWQLSVTVLSTGSSAGMVDSSLQLRRNQPEKYKETKEHVGDTDFIIMSSSESGGSDKVAYSFQNGNVSEIAVTGYRAANQATDQAQLETIFKDVLTSWKWK